MTDITCPHGKPALDPKIAKEIATRVRSRGDHPIQAYKCKTCGKWHVGSKNNIRRLDKRSKKSNKYGKE